MDRSNARDGWTLVELVAVLALLGGAVAILAPRFGRGPSAADAALAAVRDLDARARAMASNGHAVRLSADGSVLRLATSSGAVLAQRDPAAGAVVELHSTNADAMTPVTFSPAALVDDYSVRVRIEGDVFAIRVDGITGHMEVSE